MDRKEYITAIKDVIYLTFCAVNERKPKENRLDKMELTAVYTAAQKHMLTSACAMALESAGIKDERFTQTKAKAIRKTAQMDIDRTMLFAELEKEGIWYMPLKGVVLKDYYPRYGMRQMSDNDILFDSTRAADVKRIMESLGFTTERYGERHHDVYVKPPVSNFEMHNTLFSIKSGERIHNYYADVKERLIKDEGNSFGYHFTDEDYYIYLTAHEYKHYSNGGTGLRSLLDTYVFLNRSADKLDFSYIEAECEKLGIADFEKQSRHLAADLFGGKNPTEEDKEMLKYIVFSGTYGNFENRVSNQIKKEKHSKVLYMLDRFFVPVSPKSKSYAVFARKFPLFYKYKILLPLLPFYRVFRSISSGRFKREANAIKKVNM